MEVFTVKTIAKLSGLSPHTIRAWERRYSAVSPKRTSGGQRTYNIEDLERLRMLKSLTDGGYSIGQVANLKQTELVKLFQSKFGQDKRAPREGKPRRDSLVSRSELETLLEDIRNYRVEQLQTRLARFRMEVGVVSFCLDLVAPLLREIGELVQDSKLDIAQEHVVSAIIRNHLAILLSEISSSSLTAGHKKKFGFCTLESDFHEFGPLILQTLCAYYGYDSIFLGPNLPNASIVEASKALNLDFLVLGITASARQLNAMEIPGMLGELEKDMPTQTQLWAGGNAFDRIEFKSDRIKVFQSFEEVIDEFQRMEG